MKKSGLIWLVMGAMEFVAACKSDGQSASTQTFTLASTGADLTVKVTASIPSSWTVEKTPDTINFNVPGIDTILPSVSIVSISPHARSEAERLAKVIGYQFVATPNAKREDLPDGRVWMSDVNDRNVHARMFIPYEGGVVMGIAMCMKDAEKKLPEIRKVLETIKVVK